MEMYKNMQKAGSSQPPMRRPGLASLFLPVLLQVLLIIVD